MSSWQSDSVNCASLLSHSFVTDGSGAVMTLMHTYQISNSMSCIFITSYSLPLYLNKEYAAFHVLAIIHYH